MDFLAGESGVLWDTKPEMGLVLLSSVPSGSVEVVDLRNRIRALISSPALPFIFPGAVTLRHPAALGPCHGQSVYIGMGFSDPRGAHHRSPIPSNSFILTLPLQLVRFVTFANHGPICLGFFGRSAGKSFFVIVRILISVMGVS